MAISRNRGWRRARSAQQQRNQAAIYKAITGRLPDNIRRPWDKQHALSCGRSNCGFCRNPRFNRNSNGSARLTMAERKVDIAQTEWIVFDLNNEHKGVF